MVYFLRLRLVFVEVFEILRLSALNDEEGQACLVCCPRLVLFVERQASPLGLHLVFVEVFEILRLSALNDCSGVYEILHLRL